MPVPTFHTQENILVIDDANSTLNSQEERRQYDRSRLIVDVFFNGQEATGVASTKDIGVGGLYMNTQADLPEGSVLLVRIPLGGEKQIVCNAEVVYSNPGLGVGLSFQGLSEQARTLLQNELDDV